MHNVSQNLINVNNKVNEIIKKKQLKTKPEVIAVTKTFPIEKIIPLLEEGHIHFGENKVQEAENKWRDIRNKYANIQLHMLGKLQSNKAKKAVELFDYIHSLDNKKLAIKISQFQKELNKKIKLFIQINVAEEKQKTGILFNELENFYNYCSEELGLNIVGLMCLPPIGFNTTEYFQILKEKSEMLKLKDLSMGMSSDYEDAVTYGSTFLRLGTVIFGERNI